MATKALNLTFKLSTDGNINGIFDLDTTESDVVTFNDGAVTGNSLSVTHSAPIDIVAAAVSTQTYVFIKNTDVTNFIKLKTAAGATYGKLLPGEFNFVGVYPSVGLEVQADTATCVVEYAIFTKN